MIGPDRLPDDVVAAALALVHRRTGLVFADSRKAAFESALSGCMRRSGSDDPASFLQRLAGTPALFGELTAEVTVGETYFLRDAGQWDLLRDRIFPALLQRHPERPIRIWSAGCASGEEPYSAAIVLHQIDALERAQILGTDLSQPALARARRGSYPAWALRGVPDPIEQHYFQRHGNRFQLVPWIRSRVELRPLNLAEDSGPGFGYGLGPTDLILCRNVLIYFDAPTVARVASRLLDSLSPDGCLMLGASDPVIGGLVPCEVEVTDAGLLYRKARAGHAAVEVSLPAPSPSIAALAPPALSPVEPDPVRAPVPAATRPDAPPTDRLAEAYLLYTARDYGGAEQLARSLIAEGANSPEVEVLLVRSLANRGELGEAGRACAAGLDAHRNCAELVYLHAVLLSQAGCHGESAEALRRAIYLDRDLIVAHLALGAALARVGDVTGARRALRSAQRLLARLPGDEPVPASDGEPAARLAEAARSQLRLLDHTAA
jgi:chemotaxis protein methyltransferase CheR